MIPVRQLWESIPMHLRGCIFTVVGSIAAWTLVIAVGDGLIHLAHDLFHLIH